MGKDKEGKKDKDRGTKSGGMKCKEVCCQKYLKKGKHCKGCPLAGECRLPE